MEEDSLLTPTFSRAGEATTARYTKIPDGSMLPETAYRIVRDETMLDGNARLNLATFVGTWMDESADKLYADAFDKNMIDKDEYPATAAIEEYCWRILADLWNAPDTFNPERFIGEAGRQVNRYAYFPFGAGARTCLGIHFANLEGLAVLATVARRYRLEQVKRKPVQPVALGSLRPAEPIRMKLVARERRDIAAEGQTRAPAGSGPGNTQTPH